MKLAIKVVILIIVCILHFYFSIKYDNRWNVYTITASVVLVISFISVLAEDWPAIKKVKPVKENKNELTYGVLFFMICVCILVAIAGACWYFFKKKKKSEPANVTIEDLNLREYTRPFDGKFVFCEYCRVKFNYYDVENIINTDFSRHCVKCKNKLRIRFYNWLIETNQKAFYYLLGKLRK